MAITQCPECGGVLSTTAEQCPHCGMRVVLCERCGGLLQPGERVCPQCGAPYYTPEEKETARLRTKRRRKLIIGTVVCVLLALILSCPGEKKHRRAVSAVIKEAIAEVTDSLGDENSLYRMGGQLAQNITGGLVGLNVRTSRYLIFSLGRVNYKGKDYVVSVGAVGRVWCIVRKEDVKKIIIQWINEQQQKVESKIPSIIRNIGKSISDFFGSGGGE
ncbi:MAG: zinc ribbon domain-containing protein [Bacteroidaceae bacterium]|nr:zinc ribbon domain-containing protein [Bacteroidaceae bacterium]